MQDFDFRDLPHPVRHAVRAPVRQVAAWPNCCGDAIRQIGNAGVARHHRVQCQGVQEAEQRSISMLINMMQIIDIEKKVITLSKASLLRTVQYFCNYCNKSYCFMTNAL